MKRWEEEVSLLKKDMVNFISWYMDVEMPRLKKSCRGERLHGRPPKIVSRPLSNCLAALRDLANLLTEN